MTGRRSARWASGLGLLLLVTGMALAGTAAAADEARPARKDLILKGDAKCTRCHDQSDDYPVLAIAQTRHGTTADARTPTCTSCHGSSDDHAENKGGGKVRPKPDVTYTKNPQKTPEQRNAQCLTCHQGGR